MKIHIEIDTTEPAPDIANLVTNILQRIVHSHGNSNAPIVVSAENLPLHEGSQFRFEEIDGTKGTMRYMSDSGQTHSATFSLETK